MRTFFVAIMLFFFGGSVQAAEQCKHKNEFERVFDVSELTDLAIKVGAGSLLVKGQDIADSSMVKGDSAVVKAHACASSESVLKKLDVVFDAGSATINTEIPDNEGWTDYARIDLEIILPKRLNLDVRDSSGEAKVQNITSLVMVDSSGELQISKVAGSVEVTDSSGALSIQDIKGDVQVTDSSGAIEASDISGNFTVLVDSSGGIDIERVAKNVLIKVDSSGSINVLDVDGDFTVGKDGSGGIRYNKVKGKVSLPNK